MRAGQTAKRHCIFEDWRRGSLRCSVPAILRQLSGMAGGDEIGDVMGVIANARIGVQDCEKGDADQGRNRSAGKIFEVLLPKLLDVRPDTLCRLFGFDQYVPVFLSQSVVDFGQILGRPLVEFAESFQL